MISCGYRLATGVKWMPVLRNFPICIEVILLKWLKSDQILFSGSILLFAAINVIEIAKI